MGTRGNPFQGVPGYFTCALYKKNSKTYLKSWNRPEQKGKLETGGGGCAQGFNFPLKIPLQCGIIKATR